MSQPTKTYREVHKSLEREILKVSSEGIIEFAYSVFGVTDSDNEFTIEPTFKKTTSEGIKRKHYLLNHDIYLRPGVIKDFWQDAKSAYARIKLNINTPLGLEVFENEKFFLNENQPLEHSYWADVINSRRMNDGRTELSEMRLKEISSLYNWAANPQAVTGSVKQMNFKQMENRILHNYKKRKDMDENMISCPNCGFQFNPDTLTPENEDRIIWYAEMLIREIQYEAVRNEVEGQERQIEDDVRAILVRNNVIKADESIMKSKIICKNCGISINRTLTTVSKAAPIVHAGNTDIAKKLADEIRKLNILNY